MSDVGAPDPLPPSVAALVQLAGERFGDAEAVVDGARRVSFAELAARVHEAARAAVALGLEPGDRAAVWAPNSLEWVVAALGLVTAGAALVPVNTRFKGPEAAYVLARCGAKVAMVSPPFLGVDYAEVLGRERARLPELREVVVLDERGWAGFLDGARGVGPAEVDDRVAALSGDDTGDVIFTSGTTGHPKGVVTTHAQTLKVFRTWSDVVGLQEGDRYLVVNPFFHTFGYKAGILACLLTGATMLPLARFDTAAVLDVVGREGVSVLPGPPTLYQSLLDAPQRAGADLGSLRLAVTGAAVVPVPLVEAMRDDLGIETVLTAYGLTEATGTVSMCRRDDDPVTVATTSGRAIPDTEVRVVVDGRAAAAGEPGEVVVRGYNVMRGYFDDPPATAEAIDTDGWLHTGDIGVLDERGYLRITDRLKDMYVVGGFNAYPAEIEQVIARHPAVAEAAVVGMPDPRLGEVGCAYVVARPGAQVDPDDVVRFAREHLANYKVPRAVRVVGELPRNASGKVVKHELRADAGAGAPADAATGSR